MVKLSPINDFLGSVAERSLSVIGLSNNAKKLTVNETIILCQKLLFSKGNASGLALSYQILAAYSAFSFENKKRFFAELLHNFAPDPEIVTKHCEAYLNSPSAKTLHELNKTSTPRYEKLISLLNQTPKSTISILGMRSDLLDLLKDDRDLKPLDTAFVDVFSNWFNRGFLGLRNINWQTSASILENIIKYEAVHGIAGWHDLERRIKPNDRMIYGFFHPNLEDEPLIFVEVALTNGMPDAIEPILTENRQEINPLKATTAVFYSISNCQNGLRGIPLGNFLIKQVVHDLKMHFPQLKEFVTLSPIVKFGDWLRTQDAFIDKLPQDLDGLTTLVESSDKNKSLQKEIMSAAAMFLSTIKAKDGKPVDPVCRFHIGNGARFERLNWGARLDDTGFKSSFGIMANYKYIIDDIEKNHEAFESSGIVTITSDIRKLSLQSKSLQDIES